MVIVSVVVIDTLYEIAEPSRFFEQLFLDVLLLLQSLIQRSMILRFLELWLCSEKKNRRLLVSRLRLAHSFATNPAGYRCCQWILPCLDWQLNARQTSWLFNKKEKKRPWPPRAHTHTESLIFVTPHYLFLSSRNFLSSQCWHATLLLLLFALDMFNLSGSS